MTTLVWKTAEQRRLENNAAQLRRQADEGRKRINSLALVKLRHHGYDKAKRCLRCSKGFTSAHPGNRLCDGCRTFADAARLGAVPALVEGTRVFECGRRVEASRRPG